MIIESNMLLLQNHKGEMQHKEAEMEKLNTEIQTLKDSMLKENQV